MGESQQLLWILETEQLYGNDGDLQKITCMEICLTSNCQIEHNNTHLNVIEHTTSKEKNKILSLFHK